jgi:hypothetical protein
MMPRFSLLPLAVAITAVLSLPALPAAAQQIGRPPTHAINPSQSLSAQPTSPVQQQIQQDYRSNLLGAQRDLLQSNPSGLGREQISIGHQLNGYDTTLH